MTLRDAVVAGIVAFGSLAAVPSAGAQTLVVRLFEQYLESLRQQAAIPGLSATIVQDGRAVWERGFGVQDRENAIPALPDTPYPVADLTQTFAAVMVLQCVEQAAVSLDDPIRRWTSRIPEPDATVRHVLAHTSQDPPGTRFTYDPDRYAALTAVIEACTGRPYRQALSRAILDRLGMQDSVPGQDLADPSPGLRASFDPDALERYAGILRRLAKPYRVDSHGNAVPSAYSPDGIDASTGLISTVRDLARFDAAIDDNVLLRPETLEWAWTNQIASNGLAVPTGLGWFVQTYRGVRIIWHFGLWRNAFSSLVVKVPARRLTLILLANSDGLSAPFSLADGDVSSSLFARVFLRLFL